MEEISNTSFEECLKALPSTALSVKKKYVARMRERITPDENVLAVSEGNLGFLAITNRRVMLASNTIEEYYFDKIGGVKETNGLLSAFLTLDILGKKSGLIINRIPKKRIGELAALISAQINQHRSASTGAVAPSPQSDDIPTQLAKFAQLKESGVITSEEFAAQKAKLLG